MRQNHLLSIMVNRAGIFGGKIYGSTIKIALLLTDLSDFYYVYRIFHTNNKKLICEIKYILFVNER